MSFGLAARLRTFCATSTLKAALETVHDAELGRTVASALTLSDEQCNIFVRRILAAERVLRELCA